MSHASAHRTPLTATTSAAPNLKMTLITSIQHATLPNTIEWLGQAAAGDYLVQVAWPLSWGEDRVAPAGERVDTL